MKGGAWVTAAPDQPVVRATTENTASIPSSRRDSGCGGRSETPRPGTSGDFVARGDRLIRPEEHDSPVGEDPEDQHVGAEAAHPDRLEPGDRDHLGADQLPGGVPVRHLRRRLELTERAEVDP